MKNKPLVSIGLPIYNEEKRLSETIESAINQTYSNLEIIISDNNSIDNSYQIALDYAKKDSRIKVIKQQANIGVTNNFKFLLDQAQGKYFFWLGAHDKISTNYVEVHCANLESSDENVMSYGNTELIDDQKVKLPYHGNAFINLDSSSVRLRALKVLNNLNYCYAIHGVFRKSVMKKFNFDVQSGPDRLMLFITAIYGKIVYTNLTTYTATAPRKETPDQMLKRLQNYSLTNLSSMSEYRREYALTHLKLVKNSNQFNFFTKIRMIVNTFQIMKSKNNISPLQILFG